MRESLDKLRIDQPNELIVTEAETVQNERDNLSTETKTLSDLLKCDCDRFAELRKSGKPRSKGRFFWTCQNSGTQLEPRCKWFRWLPKGGGKTKSKPSSQYYLLILPFFCALFH